PAPARRRRPAVPSSGPVVGTAPAGRAGVLARLAGRILGVAAAVPAALQVSAPTPGPALHHEGAALRAGPRNRRVPGHETALRVVRAAVKGTPLAAAAHDDLAAALGAVHARLLQQGLREATLGITGTGQEAAVTAVLDDQLATAHLAGLIRLFDGEFHPARLAFGPGEHRLKALVELAQDLAPGALARFDVVGFLFHARRELDVDDVREMFLEQRRDRGPELGRLEAAVLLGHVTPFLDRFDDRGVGAGPADPVLFQRLDQHRLGIAGRRLGEMLPGHQVMEVQGLARL